MPHYVSEIRPDSYTISATYGSQRLVHRLSLTPTTNLTSNAKQIPNSSIIDENIGAKSRPTATEKEPTFAVILILNEQLAPTVGGTVSEFKQ